MLYFGLNCRANRKEMNSNGGNNVEIIISWSLCVQLTFSISFLFFAVLSQSHKKLNWTLFHSRSSWNCKCVGKKVGFSVLLRCLSFSLFLNQKNPFFVLTFLVLFFWWKLSFFSGTEWEISHSEKSPTNSLHLKTWSYEPKKLFLSSTYCHSFASIFKTNFYFNILLIDFFFVTSSITSHVGLLQCGGSLRTEENLTRETHFQTRSACASVCKRVCVCKRVFVCKRVRVWVCVSVLMRASWGPLWRAIACTRMCVYVCVFVCVSVCLRE